MKKPSHIAILLLLFLSLSAPNSKNLYGSEETLTVGTKLIEPFVMRNSDGSWGGISIDLWLQIADELDIRFELKEMDNMTDLFEGLTRGNLDIAIAAITMTSDREQLCDFSHPFYTTSLSIAVPAKRTNSVLSFFERFFSLNFLKAIASIIFILLLVGILIWFFERKHNKKHFGGRPIRGVCSGFWWSAVTMTTVGYGDKTPVTFCGRMLAIIWMFTAIIMITGLTAAITTSLTITQLESTISDPKDLPKLRVATVSNSTSEHYLKENHVPYLGHKTVMGALRSLVAGNSDAVVYDTPLLQYLVNTKMRGQVNLLPHLFEFQHYGIALTPGSPLREQINQVLLEKIRRPQWRDHLRRYLGD